MEKVNIEVNANTPYVELRTGEALPIREQEPLVIKGILSAPLEFLQKRLHLLAIPACHVLVNREEMQIELRMNETSYFEGIITGVLQEDARFTKFGINGGRNLSTHDLAHLLKMNRAYFAVRSQCNELVLALQNFKAKVDKEIESSNDNRANATELRKQVVTSNIPPSFKLNVPVFKGLKPIEIEVEVYINANDFSCTLVSADSVEKVADLRDVMIDDVLDKIKELSPELVIIEQ